MRLKTKSIGKVMIIIMAMFCLLASFFNLSIGMRFASAEEVRYTSVLEDLQKDESFNPEEYPVDSDDYSLKVIQIAESVNEELFVYVYQPSADAHNIVASKITYSIVSPLREDKDYVVYNLKLLNNSGVFYKYKVLGFSLSEDNMRYYEITEIFRAWNEKLDEPADEGTISHVPYTVGKRYIVYDTDNGPIYSCQQVDVLEIVDKYVGFVRKQGPFEDAVLTFVDSHFVAFSTNYDIGRLFEAEVYYLQQTGYCETSETNFENMPFVWSLATPRVVTFDESSSGEIVGGFGLWHYEYSFDRIQTVDEFLENNTYESVFDCGLVNVVSTNSISEEGKKDLEGMQWVLQFAETELSYDVSEIDLVNPYHVSYQNVAGVSILRLKFEVDGDVYNLGVVDNMQTGDGKPDNESNTSVEAKDWLKKLLIVLAIVFGCFILAPFLPTIITWIFKAIWWILKGVWWLIKAPFVAIKNLIDKGRK